VYQKKKKKKKKRIRKYLYEREINNKEVRIVFSFWKFSLAFKSCGVALYMQSLITAMREREAI
jgi:hypothetical protein